MRKGNHAGSRCGRARTRHAARRRTWCVAVSMAGAAIATTGWGGAPAAWAGTDGTWTNATSGGAWSNQANWSGNTIADGQDGTADFSTLNITADDTVHLDSTRTIGNLKFADAATASNNWILDNNGAGANVLTLATSTGTPTITVSNQTATISANIAGTQGLSRLGGGTLVLSAANTALSGAITSDGGGDLRLTNSAALGSASGVTLNNTSAAGGTGTQLELQNNITVNGIPLTMTSNGTSNFRSALHSSSGSNTWGGAISLTGSGLTQFYADGGNLTVNGAIGAGTGGFTGTLFLRGSSGTGTINNTINIPSGAVGKTDGSTFVIASTGNAWTTTLVAVGTLKVGATNAFPVATVVTMGQGDTNNATLDLNNFDQTIGGIGFNSTGGTKAITNAGGTLHTLTVNNTSSSTFGSSAAAGIITGNLNLTKTGAGNLTLGTANTYTGVTTITGGTLTLAAANALPATGMSLGGATFATGGLSDNLGALTLTSGATIDLGNGASLLKYAASAAQAWTGTLTINNWTGSPSGGGTDQLFFGTSSTGLTSAQLSQINFTGFGTGAQILPSGEVVPTPEPASLTVAALAAAGLLARRRRAR